MKAKSDAELIEEAERRSGLIFFGSYDALKNIELAVELARRLKSANEKIYHLREDGPCEKEEGESATWCPICYPK